MAEATRNTSNSNSSSNEKKRSDCTGDTRSLQCPLYLGLDLSTQQLKAVIVNHQLDILHEAKVHFDNDLPHFSTKRGVHRHADAHVVTAPCLMWIEAVDLLLSRLKQQSVDLSLIKGISASAQQHGSVYWKKGAHATLSTLDTAASLAQQLKDAFSITDSPVWMDSSTSVECSELEKAVGGPDQLARITGSRAYERFTGSQILKIAKNKREVYDNTERISLVSSFVASLFLGSYAPIDTSDASGMNLYDITRHEWNDTLINCISGDLKDKLGKPVLAGTPIGCISSYFVQKYGFTSDCMIAACTGDNPASLVGMALRDGDIAVSLGTSDTIFMWIKHPQASGIHGHILCNPLDYNAYIAMLCYKNGDLTRSRFRDTFGGGSWQTFYGALSNTPPGNNGNIGLFFDLREIYPLVEGDYRFNADDVQLAKDATFGDSATEVRACIEGQFIKLRTHARDIGCVVNNDTRIIATGGGSSNKAVLQVLSDVFNAKVYVQEIPNSAALGAAYLARLTHSDDSSGREAFTIKSDQYQLAAAPAADADAIYSRLEARYRKLQQRIIEQN